MSVVEQLAEEIVSRGTRHAFGVPGSGVTLSLIDALERRGLPFHLSHFEGAGALMAATIGHLSGIAGVSMSIKGPGLANSLPGITAAWFEAFPLVHLSEAFSPDSLPSQAHKRIDQQLMVKAISKTVCRYSTNGSRYSDVARLAEVEEPGPIVLELTPSFEEAQSSLPNAEEVIEDSSSALELVRRASSPVVIAGALAARAGFGPLLSSLPCPVFSTASAKGVVDESLHNAAGVFTGVGLELTPEYHLLRRADLVVALGLTAREVLATRPFSCPFVAIDAVDTAGTDGFGPVARVGLCSAEEILSLLKDKPDWGLDLLAHVKKTLRTRMLQDFLPAAAFVAIEQRFERRARIVMDTGYFCTIGEHALSIPSPDMCLMSGQGRYMGTGLPMAIGAALHDSTTPTVAVLGDGGVGMYLAEAKLAASNKLPLLIVLMTDNAFGSIRTRALKDRLTQKPLTMDGRTWVGIFDSLGLPGTRADSPASLEDALAAWRPESGPAFVEIPFPPDAYEAMVVGIR